MDYECTWVTRVDSGAVGHWIWAHTSGSELTRGDDEEKIALLESTRTHEQHV